MNRKILKTVEDDLEKVRRNLVAANESRLAEHVEVTQAIIRRTTETRYVDEVEASIERIKKDNLVPNGRWRCMLDCGILNKIADGRHAKGCLYSAAYRDDY